MIICKEVTSLTVMIVREDEFEEPRCGPYLGMLQGNLCGRISTSTTILGLQLFIAFAVPAALIVTLGWVLDRLMA